MGVASACFEARLAQDWLDVYNELERLVVGFVRDDLGWYSISHSQLGTEIAAKMRDPSKFDEGVFACLMSNIYQCDRCHEFDRFVVAGVTWYSGNLPADYTFEENDNG